MTAYTQPKFIMLVGLPGSGKSTWTAKNRGRAVVISSDNYIEAYAKRVGKTYSEVFTLAIGYAKVQMNNDLKAAIAAKKDVIWDQTNLTVDSRVSKLRLIPKEYQKAALVFTTSHEELLKRIAARPGKEIPTKVFTTMRDSFEPPTEAEGFDKITIVRN